MVCEMLMIPHCLNTRLTDGDEIVSFKRRPHFTPQKHYFSASGNLCLSAAGRIR
jgi:hypothetical protein